MMSEPWFDPNLFGAYVGTALGIAGGLYGTAVGIIGGVLVPRGKGRGPLKAILASTVVVGVALLALGLYALADGQPYGIWYVLVLGGALFSVIGGIQLVSFRAIGRQIDRRKMEADDLRHT